MEKTGKIVTIVLWSLLIISAVLMISLMVNIGEDTDPTMGGWISNNLIWAYILTIFGAGVAVLAGLYHTVTDKKAAKGGLISLAFMGTIAIVSYLLAEPEIPQFIGVDKFINDGTLNENIAKWIDTGLYATYILLGISILSIVVTSVTRLFK